MSDYRITRIEDKANVYTPYNKDFAARIKALRTEANLTQQGFADLLGVDRTTVARWELGRNEPAAYVIDLIEYKLRMHGYIK